MGTEGSAWDQVNSLCAELRKCTITLVDSFNFSDHIVRLPFFFLPVLFPSFLIFLSSHQQINSPLGVHSGDIYNKYFERVRASNPHQTVHPCSFSLFFFCAVLVS